MLKGTTVVNFYAGSCVYRGNKTLDYLLHPEGVVRATGQELSYEYFLKDHLGNTRVVFSSDGAVLQTTDYYAFGMSHTPKAKENENRYLYNGKELQNVSLNGVNLSWYDYGSRFYSGPEGRWWVIDPDAESYYNISPYAYCANNPIIFIDPDGQKIRLANNYAGAMTNIAQIAATSLGSQVMNRLISNSQTYTMSSTFFSKSSSFNPDNRKISYVGNPWYDEVPYDGGALTSMTAMGHESMHAFDHTRLGFSSDDVKNPNLKNALELRAVSFANYLRDVYSLEPSKEKYGSIDGNFNQFSTNGNEKISDFTTLGTNEDATSMGFSYTKTTKTVLSYKKIGIFKVPDKTKTETSTYYMTVSMDANKNITYQIYNNEEDYKKATSNW